jgi:hypothetical protein
VGRFIGYAVFDEGRSLLGTIVGSSATLNLPGRSDFFGKRFKLNQIVNNSFFHVHPPRQDLWFPHHIEAGCVRAIEAFKAYPVRNTTRLVLQMWRSRIAKDWLYEYGDQVIGFESLVMPPRIGEVYLRDHWDCVGMTKGFICRRVGGYDPTEKFGGVRVWQFDAARRKLVFLRRADS